MKKYSSSNDPNILLDIEGDPATICRKFNLIEVEVEDPVDPKHIEIQQFRREYLDTTAALCALAGETYTGKLENVDYKRIVNKASSNPITGILSSSLVYCRTVLRELDGENWFENISGL